jgi:hypothetical protein
MTIMTADQRGGTCHCRFVAPDSEVFFTSAGVPFTRCSMHEAFYSVEPGTSVNAELVFESADGQLFGIRRNADRPSDKAAAHCFFCLLERGQKRGKRHPPHHGIHPLGDDRQPGVTATAPRGSHRLWLAAGVCANVGRFG